MDEKETLANLIKILEKYDLTIDEQEAVKHAIGVLSWTKLRKGAINSIKDKQVERKRSNLC